MSPFKHLTQFAPVLLAIIALMVGLLIPSPLTDGKGSSAAPQAEPVNVFGTLPDAGHAPLAMDQAAGLAGTEWGTEVEGGVGRISFTKDGYLSLEDGCNGLLAPYEIAGSVLTLGEGTTTRKACPPALQKNGTLLTEFLYSTQVTLHMSTDGSHLWFVAGDKALRLRKGA